MNYVMVGEDFFVLLYEVPKLFLSGLAKNRGMLRFSDALRVLKCPKNFTITMLVTWKCRGLLLIFQIFYIFFKYVL